MTSALCQVQFASVMETLGNEALGKIMNIVDEARLLVQSESMRGTTRPQTSVLNILNNARVGRYTGPAPSIKRTNQESYYMIMMMS